MMPDTDRIAEIRARVEGYRSCLNTPDKHVLAHRITATAIDDEDVLCAHIDAQSAQLSQAQGHIRALLQVAGNSTPRTGLDIAKQDAASAFLDTFGKTGGEGGDA